MYYTRSRGNKQQKTAAAAAVFSSGFEAFKNGDPVVGNGGIIISLAPQRPGDTLNTPEIPDDPVAEIIPVQAVVGHEIRLGQEIQSLIFQQPFQSRVQGRIHPEIVLRQLAPDDVGMVLFQLVDTTGIEGLHAPGAIVTGHGLYRCGNQLLVITSVCLQFDDHRGLSGEELQHLMEGGDGFLCAVQAVILQLFSGQIGNADICSGGALQGTVVHDGQGAVLDQMDVQLNAVTLLQRCPEGGHGVFGLRFVVEAPVGITPAFQCFQTGMAGTALGGKQVSARQCDGADSGGFDQLLHGLILNIQRFQTLLGGNLCVAVAGQGHGHKCKTNKDSGVGEQDGHAHLIHQEAGEHGRCDLGGHGGGVVEAGIFADVGTGAHLDHHGEGVDIDGCPGDTCQNEHGVHHPGGAGGTHEGSAAEGGGQHHNTAQNGLLPAESGGDGTGGQVRDDGSGLGQQHGGVVVLVQNVAGIDGILGGDGVVTEIPQGNGGQDQQQGTLLGTGKAALFLGIGNFFLNAVFNGVGCHLSSPLFFPDGTQEDGQGTQHNGCDDTVVDGIAHHGILNRGGGEDHAKNQNQNSAGSAHQIDDGVCLGAQGLHGHIGHQGNGRGTEGCHGQQNHQKQHHKEDQRQGIGCGLFGCIGLTGRGNIIGVVGIGDGLAGFGIGDLAADGGEFLLAEGFGEHHGIALGGQKFSIRLGIIDRFQSGRIINGCNIGDVLQLQIVHEGKANQGNRGKDGAQGDEGSALAVFGIALVGQGTENRQQEHGEDVVQCHDHAGPGLGHTEFVGQNHRDGGIVGLPESADQEKGEADQNGTFVVEFHRDSSGICVMDECRIHYTKDIQNVQQETGKGQKTTKTPGIPGLSDYPTPGVSIIRYSSRQMSSS